MRRFNAKTSTTLIYSSVSKYCVDGAHDYAIWDIPPRKKNKYLRAIFLNLCEPRDYVDRLIVVFAPVCCTLLGLVNPNRAVIMLYGSLLMVMIIVAVMRIMMLGMMVMMFT